MSGPYCIDPLCPITQPHKHDAGTALATVGANGPQRDFSALLYRIRVLEEERKQVDANYAALASENERLVRDLEGSRHMQEHWRGKADALKARVAKLEEAILYAMHDDNWRRVHDLELKWPETPPTTGAPTPITKEEVQEALRRGEKDAREMGQRIAETFSLPTEQTVLRAPTPREEPKQYPPFNGVCSHCGTDWNLGCDCYEGYAVAPRTPSIPTGKNPPQNTGNAPSGKELRKRMGLPELSEDAQAANLKDNIEALKRPGFVNCGAPTTADEPEDCACDTGAGHASYCEYAGQPNDRKLARPTAGYDTPPRDRCLAGVLYPEPADVSKKAGNEGMSPTTAGEAGTCRGCGKSPCDETKHEDPDHGF